MGRYCTVQNVKDWIVGYDIPALEYIDEVLEQYINDAENDVDSFTQTQFNWRHYLQIQNGNGSYSVLIKDSPLFSLQSLTVKYYPLSVVRTFSDDDGYLVMNRRIGKISIRPTFALVGAFPPDYAQYYAYIFPRGENNLTIDAYVGHSFAGDNFSAQRLQESGFSDLMMVSTDAQYVYFNFPKAVMSTRDMPKAIVDNVAGAKMFKSSQVKVVDGDFIDDSANWDILSPTRVRAQIASYDPAKLYRFVYIPTSVGMASVKLAIAYLLTMKGGRDDFLGSGGASNRNVSGFSESYKEGFMYGSIAVSLREEAFRELERWRKVVARV